MFRRQLCTFPSAGGFLPDRERVKATQQTVVMGARRTGDWWRGTTRGPALKNS